MTDRIEQISSVRPVPPVKLRRIRRKGEDGQGQTHTWRELLKDQINFDKEKKRKKKKKKPEKRPEGEKTASSEPDTDSSKGHLDVIA